MKQIIFKDQKAVGYLEGDTFTPLPPAPTGDALLDLLDDCCDWFEEWVGRHKKKLASELHADSKGHASQLMDGRHECGASMGHGGIRSWITQGTLRDRQQMADVVNDYLDRAERRARMTRSQQEWMFDNISMQDIGAKFGANLPRVAKTSEQIAADAEERSAEIRRNNAERERQNQELAEYEIELDRKLRVKRMLAELSAMLWTMEDIYVNGDVMPPEYFAVSTKRRVFRQFNKDLVTAMVNAGKSDDEIQGWVITMHEIVRGDFRSSIPDPLKPGEVRQYFENITGVFEYVNTVDLSPEQEMATQLVPDGRWCVTIRQRTVATEEMEVSLG